MSKPPAKFEDALWEAEDICARRICDIIGKTLGVDCFISTNGGKYECAVFDIGYLCTGTQAGFPSSAYHFRGRLDLYNRQRRSIQKDIMRLLEGMPLGTTQAVPNDLGTTTNVMCLRIAPKEKGVDEITTVELKANKDDKGVPVFTTAVEFDIVFDAGARATAQ